MFVIGLRWFRDEFFRLGGLGVKYFMVFEIGFCVEGKKGWEVF